LLQLLSVGGTEKPLIIQGLFIFNSIQAESRLDEVAVIPPVKKKLTLNKTKYNFGPKVDKNENCNSWINGICG
jgi:hypothetical protein